MTTITTIAPIVTAATSITIANQADLTSATELLSTLNKQLDAVKAEKEKVLKPLRDAANAEKARWKPLEDMLEQGVTAVRLSMSTYMTAQKKAEAEAQQKIADKMASGRLKPETAVKKLSALETVETSVSTDVGMVKFRTTQKLVITDYEALPRRFLVPDESSIKAALKAGEKVPGAELVEEQVPVNYR